jgi:hypothetical protein
VTERADLKLRLPKWLGQKIRLAAQIRGHSINAEMVLRLERTFIEDAERETKI